MRADKRVVTALGIDTPIQILDALDEPRTVSEAVERTSISQATFYRYLSKLRGAGLVEIAGYGTTAHPDGELRGKDVARYQRTVERISIGLSDGGGRP